MYCYFCNEEVWPNKRYTFIQIMYTEYKHDSCTI